MNLKGLIGNTLKILTNIRGWTTNRKIVVIDSDDWGSIRTPNCEVKNNLLNCGYEVDKCHYTSFDSLESSEDLECLFEVLKSVKTQNGINPIITANCIVTNPAFNKIRKDNFQEYHYEYVTETFNKYPKHKNSFNLWNEGYRGNIFKPQLHGREHLNISRWLRDLKNNDKEAKMMFDLEMFGISTNISKNKRGSYLAALDGGDKELIFDRKIIIRDACKIFENLLGYKPSSFIATNYIWNEEIEKELYRNGIKFIQSQRGRVLSSDYGVQRKIVRNYTGQRNKLGQIYLIRNCQFETSSNYNVDWVDSCLREINIAFKCKKPAIISAHRVNFMGFIEKKNRDRGLRLLKELLNKITIFWPNIEFLSSEALGAVIENNNLNRY